MLHADTYPHANATNAEPNAHGYADRDSYPHPKSNSAADADGNSYAHSNSDTNSYRHGNSDGYP
jgi:hypothetical protein